MSTGDLPASSGLGGLEDASADVLRGMFTIGGPLLDELAHDTVSRDTVLFLCESVRALLDAEWIVVDGGDGERAVARRGEQGRWNRLAGIDTDSASIVAEVATDESESGAMSVGFEPRREATDQEHAVVERFALLASMVLRRLRTRADRLRAIAREREAFAGEIHDEPVQLMTAASLALQRLERRVGDDDDTGAALRAARSLTDDAIASLRQIMYSMHPITLDEDGLGDAIEAYCEAFVDRDGLCCTVRDDSVTAPPNEVAGLAFRLARSSILNALHHADASRIDVVISTPPRRLRVEIHDNGQGFDLDDVAHTRVGHFGIPHARTLAGWAGGSYRIESAPGNGTTVTVDLPADDERTASILASGGAHRAG